MLQAKPGRSGKQPQEQIEISPNLGTAVQNATAVTKFTKPGGRLLAKPCKEVPPCPATFEDSTICRDSAETYIFIHKMMAEGAEGRTLNTLRSPKIQGLSATHVSGHLAGSKNKHLSFARWPLSVYLGRP